MLGKLSDFQRRLFRWYASNARDLPWRTGPGAPRNARPNPYYVLVSEAMLQQTQVATVIPFFLRFVQRLPTIADLAAIDPQELLRLWQGLGYYARARNLQATAKLIVIRYGSQLPSSVRELRELPGIGPYTAGAIASIAHNKREAILDGNVARVLCRLDAIKRDPAAPAVRKLLWERAYEILPHRRVGHFNSALMDLGATVCTPRSPNCSACPAAEHCAAQAQSMVHRIPQVTSGRARPLENRCTFCIRHRGKYLIEQRPASGRWASMWQFPTIAMKEAPTPAEFARHFALETHELRELATLRHDLTHRRYEFRVFICNARHSGDVLPRRWASLAELDQLPLPRPHLRIAQLLKSVR